MGFLDRLIGLFGKRAHFPSTVEKQLEAHSASVLANALDRLRTSERGWITYAQYSRLFATSDATEEPSDQDLQALLTLGQFATEHRCKTKSTPSEKRVYFTKSV
jgi:hypothetical protein